MVCPRTASVQRYSALSFAKGVMWIVLVMLQHLTLAAVRPLRQLVEPFVVEA